MMRVPVRPLSYVKLRSCETSGDGLFRLLRRFHDVGRESEGYRESRESLRPLRERTSRFPRKFGLFAGRNRAETIRHYYERFLSLSLKRNISLLHSDTTSEIEKKGEEHFDKGVLKDMRAIYIRVRYGEEACGEDRVREFAGLLKRLAQGSRAK
ncbi:hypothetical protein [Acididesulfobacillus acetoxydans]|nr:hypothetical protein [Acididesulfobacillus acetoxydans]